MDGCDRPFYGATETRRLDARLAGAFQRTNYIEPSSLDGMQGLQGRRNCMYTSSHVSQNNVY